MALHPDRPLPIDPGARVIARRLYQAGLPLLSRHGHAESRCYAEGVTLDPETLFLQPDEAHDVATDLAYILTKRA